jgi:hypothetical protein
MRSALGGRAQRDRRRGVPVTKREVCKLGTGGDFELYEYSAEVIVDRPGREEELRCDLLVGEPFCDETGDLELLRCQHVDRARVASALGRERGAEPFAERYIETGHGNRLASVQVDYEPAGLRVHDAEPRGQ